MSNTFSEFRFYSPLFDAVCLRISVSDGHTGEFFAIVPDPGIGRSLREARDRALNAIESAMESGILPGEVKVEANI
jgi:hypothetical protein